MIALPSRSERVELGLDLLVASFDVERLFFDQFPATRVQLACPFKERSHVLTDRIHAVVMISMRQSDSASAAMTGLTGFQTDDGH